MFEICVFAYLVVTTPIQVLTVKKKGSSIHKLLALWNKKGFVQAIHWSRWPLLNSPLELVKLRNFVLVLVLCRALSQTPSSLPINQTQHCKLLPGMVSSQAQLCRSNLELMQTVIQAAREVKKTCQKTFADMRWNCSSIDIPVDGGKYRPDLERGMPLLFLLLFVLHFGNICGLTQCTIVFLPH